MPPARANYKSLAQELERLGAQMAVNNKPSFNCATARRPVEKAICADPELGQSRPRDQRRVSPGGRGPAKTAATRWPLTQQQHEFIAQRNAAFGKPGYDLQKAMKERLNALTGVDGY